jgi:hypothetical protein
LSWGITPLLVLKLVTKVATEVSAARTVPHLAMADVGENAKIQCRTHGNGKGGSEIEMDMFSGERRLRSGGECVVCGRAVLCVPTSAR